MTRIAHRQAAAGAGRVSGRRQPASKIIAGCSAAMLALALGAVLPAQAPSSSPPSAAPAPAPVSAGDLLGGVPRGRASGQVLRLSLAQAVSRGLQANLAALLASSQTASARAGRLAALSGLLPHVQAQAYDLRQKVSLAAFGINFPGVPPIIGPFNVADARLYLHENLLSLSNFQQWRAARAGAQAAASSYRQIRNLVVEAVSDQYQLTLADAASLAAAQAQLATATQAWRQARDKEKSGLVNALDVVRAQVQRAAERQRVIAARYALAGQRLRFARMIGLPEGQRYILTDRLQALPPAPPLNPRAAVAEAWRRRPDLLAAAQAVRAAQLSAAAARDRRVPQFSLDANYGTIGHTFTADHPTFVVEGSLSMPLFAGGQIRAATAAARQRLRRARERLADLRAAVAEQVRLALLNLQSSYHQARVAAQARAYATQELQLARDRFHAGVADNLDEVRAEQALAQANQGYIASLYQYNAARAALATALGRLPLAAMPGAH